MSAGQVFEHAIDIKASMGRVPLIDGGTVTVSSAFIRSLVPAAFGVIPGVGMFLEMAVYFWAFIDPRRQAIHDKAAGTLVVYAERDAPRLPAPQAAAVAPPLPLRQDEQGVIVAFAERSPQMTYERQAELAEHLDVSRQAVNAIETGKHDPSLPLAFRIARLFDLPIEEIFHDGQ